MRLHLAKDILMIQEQDVICVSGEPFYSGVSSFYFFFKMFFTKKSAVCMCVQVHTHLCMHLLSWIGISFYSVNTEYILVFLF